MARNSGKLAETPNVVRRYLRIRGFGDLDGEIEMLEGEPAVRRFEDVRLGVMDDAIVGSLTLNRREEDSAAGRKGRRSFDFAGIYGGGC